MASVVEQLAKKGLTRPPSFVVSNTIYETIVGSVAYGVSTDDSDFDLIGVCIPTKELLFPHLAGEIAGFGRQIKRFELFEHHHVFDKDAVGGRGREYDLNVYSIVRYFQLLMDNNPNMLDTLFTPRECILYSTPISEMIREKRKLFLHKGAWHRFKGFAYSQLHMMSGKNPEEGSNRAELREKFGFDVKHAYNVVRLLGEVEQLLNEHDIDLRRHQEHLKAIRRGEVSEFDIRRWAADKEAVLEKAYSDSTLPYRPDEKPIRQLLIDCLEHHYGDLSGAVINPDAATVALREIRDIIERVAA